MAAESATDDALKAAIVEFASREAGLSLADHEADRVTAALGRAPSTPEERLAELQRLALKELLEWLSGRRRFDTVPQSDAHRILELFLNVRREPLTVEVLVNDLSMPPGRATAIVSRLRYAEARKLRQLAVAAAVAELTSALSDARVEGSSKTIWVTPGLVDLINEAQWSILRDAPSKKKGGRYESAQKLAVDAERYGATVSGTAKMWDYVVDWFKAEAGQ